MTLRTILVFIGLCIVVGIVGAYVPRQTDAARFIWHVGLVVLGITVGVTLRNWDRRDAGKRQ